MGILDSIVEWIAEQVMHGLDLVNTSVLGALGCDMAVFLRYFPAAQTMYEVFVALAIGLILLLWVCAPMGLWPSSPLSYVTKSGQVTAVKLIVPLDRNDMSYVPATMVKNGVTLSLSNVEWQVIGTDLVGELLAPSSYQALATYTGSTSYQAAAGYTTTAEYTGTARETDMSSTPRKKRRNPFEAHQKTCWAGTVRHHGTIHDGSGLRVGLHIYHRRAPGLLYQYQL